MKLMDVAQIKIGSSFAELLGAVRAAGGFAAHVREPRMALVLIAAACARGGGAVAVVDPPAAAAADCDHSSAAEARSCARFLLGGRAPVRVLALTIRFWWGGGL